MKIRQAKVEDAARIAEIYNWYILNTTITFETDLVSPSEMEQRIEDNLKTYDWLVGECNREIVGYAYYGSFRSRAAYDRTVESTIYLTPESSGKGIGKSLYGELIASVQSHGFREIIGIISLPNSQSITLHQNMGFVEIGVLKRVGYKLARYIDISIWQKSVSLDN